MKPKDIQELIDFISKSGLNEVNVETNDFKIAVKREAEKEYKIIEGAATPAPAPVAAAPAPAPVQASAPAPAASGEAPAPADAGATASAGTTVEIKAPMIGTLYRRPDPDAENFVSVGDEVKKGQVVCIIEAMKLFNEIESDVDGRIVKILADDSTPVEYDQPLFLVEPA